MDNNQEKKKMTDGTKIAIVSILVTAIASGFGNFMQYRINQAQQAHILELEKYKQSKKAELLKMEFQIKQFNEYCEKVELAIKDTTELRVKKTLNHKDADISYSADISSFKYLYLLPISSQSDVLKETGEDLTTAVLTALLNSYSDCRSSLD